MPYTQPTLAQAKAALAARLDDVDKVHWVDAELGVYLIEALRTWNAWCAHWRESAAFNTDGSTFYELGTYLPTLRAMSVTNWQMVSSIQYTLLEPPTPTSWTGTAQFTLQQVCQAVQRRRDLFLSLTGAVLTRTVTNYQGGSLPAGGAIALDESVVQVRRAAWRPTATQLLWGLRRADEWGADYFKTDWRTPGTPQAYSVAATPPLNLQLMPPASLDGDLDLISINKGADIVTDPTTEVVLGVPDDWCWVVKYGALSDLFNADGLARDQGRAAYCESRWKQGIAMALSAPVVISATLDGVAVGIGNLSDADAYTPTWQLLQGTPQRVLTTGQNLVTTWPVASGVTAVGLTVVRNAPVPASDVDVLQVGADLYDTILDLAQHAATVKEGAGQLDQATSLLQRAGDAAGVKLSIQQATQPNRAAMLTSTRTDTLTSNPQQVEPVEIP